MLQQFTQNKDFLRLSAQKQRLKPFLYAWQQNKLSVKKSLSGRTLELLVESATNMFFP